MSVVLRRGDRVHIAFPISPTLYGKELQAKVAEDASFMTDEYAAQGVTVVSWSACSTCTHPVIVAVFRDFPPEQPEVAD